MTRPLTDTEVPLLEQQESLRRHLQAQRQTLARQLTPAGTTGDYPRSMTLRTLTLWPSLLARLATKIIGPRLLRVVPVILVLVQLVRLTLAGQKNVPLALTHHTRIPPAP